MKVRTDFVTNSSSSSFVCVICDNEETCYDGGGAPEWYRSCENEHGMCVHHLLNDEANEDGETAISACPVCSFVEYADYEMASYLEKTRGVSRDEVFAEIKRLNKRRKKLYDNEYISHVLVKFEISDSDVMNEIKARFGTWNAYYDFLRERNG